METIDKHALAVLLNIPKKDAQKKLQVAADKLKLTFKEGEEIEIPLEKAKKVMGIDFEFYINNIQKNYLKPGSTRSYIMNYPLEKMKPKKKDGLFPKTVSIPSFIRQFLTPDQISEILTEWRERFKGWGNGKENDFEPIKFR